MSNRDNFKPSTKRILAERVAWRCCFPNCGKITIGPSSDNPEKSINLGEAAHIHAAAEKGPRYDKDMSPEARKSINNGIWMCRHHAKFIDDDYVEYSSETLKKWKQIAERSAYDNLKKGHENTLCHGETFLAIGFKIIVRGYWKAASSNEWSFVLGSFLKGTEDNLSEYVSSFTEISPNQRFIIVESQGDARKITEPMSLQYGNDNEIILNVKIKEKNKPSSPVLCFDLAYDGDLIIENGNLKTVSGIEAAIQHLTFATSTVYGAWSLDPTMGSFASEYYRHYREDLHLLSRLFKIEFTRLSLIPASDEEVPTLGFVKRIEEVNIKSAILKDHKLYVDMKLEWGNNEKWAGTVPVWIDLNIYSSNL